MARNDFHCAIPFLWSFISLATFDSCDCHHHNPPTQQATHSSLPSNANTLKNSFECCGDIRCAANWPTRRRSEKLCFIIMTEWVSEWVQLWCVNLSEKKPRKCRIYYHIIQYYMLSCSCKWHRFASWLVTDTTRNCCLLSLHARSAHTTRTAHTEWQAHSFVISESNRCDSCKICFGQIMENICRL